MDSGQPTALLDRADADVDTAVRALRRGEVVAHPAETVYGLAADALDASALASLRTVRGGAVHVPTVHVAGAEELGRWAAVVPDAAHRLAERLWPGPLTLVLPARPELPRALTAPDGTVRLRVPDHPVTLDLLRSFGRGLAVVPASRRGGVPATSRVHVVADLAVAVVLDGGPSRVGLEPTVVDLTGEPVLTRPGPVSGDRVAAALGVDAAELRTARDASAAGHPRTPVVVVAETELPDALRRAAGPRRRTAVLSSREPRGAGAMAWWRMPCDPAGYARALYAVLREMDSAHADVAVVEQPPAGGAWEAVRDRLDRLAAASRRGAVLDGTDLVGA